MLKSATRLLLPLLLFAPPSVRAQETTPLADAAKQVAGRFMERAGGKRGDVEAADTTIAPASLRILLGEKDGIQVGDMLEVMAKGRSIVVNGEIVGHIEKPIGTAEVNDIKGDHRCTATMKTMQPGVAPNRDCVACLRPLPGSVAVGGLLRRDRSTCGLGDEFADKLGEALQATGRFRIIERVRLEEALRKLRQSPPIDYSGPMSPLGIIGKGDFCQQLRRMAGADGVVFGTVDRSDGSFHIVVMVLDLRTKTSTHVAAVTCPVTAELDRLYIPLQLP